MQKPEFTSTAGELPESLLWNFDGFEDPLGVVNSDSLPPPPGASAPPEGLSEIDGRLWQWAIHDIQANVIEGTYFGAGGSFGPTVFTRDLAYSGILSLNRLFPELMWSSLRLDRELRFRVDWRVTRASSAPDTTDLPFVRTPFDYQEFVSEYQTGEFSRRSDDVVWLWAAFDWLRWNGGETSDWRWVYETGKACFEKYYEPFFDAADGLYRGQATFVDIMMCGYPSQSHLEHSGDARDFFIGHLDDPEDGTRWNFGRFPASLRRSLMGKCSSTNALYVIGLSVMSEMALRLGERGQSADWAYRRDALVGAARKAFLTPEGGVAFQKGADGESNSRQHSLSAAFFILAEILDRKESSRALMPLPQKFYGVHLFHPFYEDNPHCYHNRSTWPFSDAFVSRAAVHAGQPDARHRWRAFTGRSCRDESGFRELTDTETQLLCGSKTQLWSAAAYCGSFLGI